ncbi:MAG: serine O-acetyltransferase [Cytophagales bacterium]|nr:serine O-acetyltransferase [Cytophagales bacterium]MDW8383246.1 serine O-acetyltransferase EpsC [Flammeovirgaceae bacterium]
MNPSLKSDFIKKLYQQHRQAQWMPLSSSICQIVSGLLEGLFPAMAERKFKSERELSLFFDSLFIDLESVLDSMQEYLSDSSEDIVHHFQQLLPDTYEILQTDIQAILSGDPAAKSEFEVIRAYPGFYAIAMYRIAHLLDNLDVPMLPRIITEFAHSRTGIDIHPSAKIGSHFFIDHGTGIVIGETCVIGQNVKIYQGVTLGALSVSKEMAGQKRHPTIEDNVVIYSGATILGGKTVIGHDSVIGGNVWLTKSVPPYTTVYHQEQIRINNDKRLDTQTQQMMYFF